MKLSNSRRPRKGRERHKHLTYFKLEKALPDPGCPICNLVQASIKTFFEAFLYEKVNDVGLRTRFNADAGICNRHAYQLLGCHDGLAIAVMYRPLLELAVDAVGRGADAPGNRGACFICDTEREAEERYLSALAEFLDDRELEGSFVSSSGLCLPHYELVRRRAPEMPTWFVELHAAKYERLLEGVKRYLDAANWSLGEKRPKLTPEEERVWTEVIALYSGYEGMPPRPKNG